MENIYEKIRLLRIQQDLTLKELSDKTSLSVSFLSQVERGNSSLAITSLQKIAEGLGVSISYFFQESIETKYYTPAKNRKSFQIERSNAVYARLGGEFEGRALEPIYITLAPYQKQEVAFNHPGEEFYYVLAGEVVMNVDEQEYHMKAGDSIHFPSTVDHAWYNPTNESVHIISVLTPSIFKN
ncbi:helix-turn-helix domain-containing protein [Gottfriedia sp. NPDC056225]|uniref:helix-turn-helix domain-containing protein n=1 Tax=Gottfriedia sp. NPDC056225 TaxID=3345751 RepID=UPI00155873AB|nr:helix-turn-helix transcriptional regulator [Arthrobacter citreus]